MNKPWQRELSDNKFLIHLGLITQGLMPLPLFFIVFITFWHLLIYEFTHLFFQFPYKNERLKK